MSAAEGWRPARDRPVPALAARSRPVGEAEPAFCYLVTGLTPTTSTGLTMMSLKVNWPLFQQDDTANWVAKYNIGGCCLQLRGGGGQIKRSYNSECQAWQMLLYADNCIDISPACQTGALAETYSKWDQMVSCRTRIKRLNSHRFKNSAAKEVVSL